MIEIPLTKGKVAIIDDEDAQFVLKHKWRARSNGKGWYARTNIRVGDKQRTITMHRMILDAPRGSVVDHINHNPLDNRRCNLRFASPSQSNYNARKHQDNTSGYKGVYYERDRKTFRASINHERVRYRLGRFPSAEEAARVYDTAARVFHGEYACLNFQYK
jgi:hypothetical protein